MNNIHQAGEGGYSGMSGLGWERVKVMCLYTTQITPYQKRIDHGMPLRPDQVDI